MRLTRFVETPWFGVILSLAVFALLMTLVSCGKKPVTTLGAVAGCGPMPVKVMLCVEALPHGADGEVDQARVNQADLKRCYANTINQLIGENQNLRTRYAPCAK